MRVILDDNVLIGAFASQGLCHALFELCLDQHHIVVSEQILTGVADNLQERVRLPAWAVENVIHYLRENALVERADPPTQRVCRDASDDWILALAEQSQVDYVITGDQDLLIVKQHHTTPIVSPRRFWEILRETDNPPW